MTTRYGALGLSFLTAISAMSALSQTGNSAPSKTETATPVLRNTCLVTKNVTRLVDFYSRVLGTQAKTSGNHYAEFHTGATVLAIFSAEAQEKYIPGSAQAASNKSSILEFEVGNVDREYSRLQSVVKEWVKPPTTQPWGTRSLYFRDPDGNLVDFYAWVKPR